VRALAEIVRLRTGDCSWAADAIPRIAAGEDCRVEAVSSHVAQCLRCQAEVAAYRRIFRHLHSLRYDRIAPPAEGLAAVLAALDAAVAEDRAAPSWAVRAAYVGGITVATAAAGAAGVLVWMSRRRPVLAHAG
jgi:hypothetical protein